ncbi:MAG: hypothetical protein ACYC9L_05655 [Sulfuricaulis sp.]
MNRQLRAVATERFDYAAGIGSGGCTDVDMLWERGGYFLAIENKHEGEEISRGQLIALRAMASQPNWTVWVVYGTPPDDIVSAGTIDGEQHALNVEQLRRRIQRWWDDHRASRAA